MTNEEHYQSLAERVRSLIADSQATSCNPVALPHSETGSTTPSPAVTCDLGDDAFNRLALDIFAFQFERNPVLHSLSRQTRRTPDRVSHWTELPAIPTLAFKAWPVTCLPDPARVRWFESSGTTGSTRGRHYHDAVSLAVYEASLYPPFCRHLLSNLSSRFHFILLTPGTSQAPQSSLAYMLDAVARQRAPHSYCCCGQVRTGGTWAIDFDACLAGLKAARAAERPVVIAGTAFSFVHLLDELRERSVEFRLPIGSRLMETGGYKGQSRTISKPNLLTALEQALGIPQHFMVSEYGMCELGSQAYDSVAGEATCLNTPHPTTPRRAFRFPPWARVRMVSPENKAEAEPGATGIIQVFDLANVASAIGIETQDLGRQLPGGFALCGRATEAEPRGCSLHMGAHITSSDT